MMNKISIIIFSFIIQNGFAAVHWGIQQQNWPFPMPKNGQSNSNQLKQISLQPNENSQSQQPPAPWNDYNEYLAKLTDYYNDYYSEYGSRYNEYLAKFSEWLKTSFGGSSNVGGPSPPPMPISPPEIGQSSIMPPGANGMNGPTLPNNSRIPFHRHRPVCPPKIFPPANKTANGSKNEPKFVHPLVLPIIHGNFTAKVNAGATSNLSIVDPFQQHLAMHSSVTVVVDHDQEGNKHIIVVDTGLAVLKHAILNGLLANGIQAHQVDTVCITHPDTDTMGNLNLFPCAEIHSGNAISRENLFARQSAPQFESNRSDLPFRRLFAHSELFLTPGLSFQDQSLVIRNVADHGTVAIVGKLILNEGDLANNLAIREFATEDSEHRKLWQATRREIVCMADYIVPGYGIPFKVSSEMKSLAECGMAAKKSSMPPFSTWGKKMA